MILSFYNIAIFDKYFGGFGLGLRTSPTIRYDTILYDTIQYNTIDNFG